MLSEFSRNLIVNLKNIPGWHINKKVVVIECDDWGGIRMPSLVSYGKLQRAGIFVEENRFTRYDTLEDKVDLASLFELLESVKDKHGKPAVITAFTNVANPDFEKIRKSGFKEYHYEPFTRTYNRNNRYEGTFNLWQEGIRKGIFVPESHGREHISVQLWMQKLLEGDKNVHLAFDNEFVSVDTHGIPFPARQFRPEFYFNNDNQKPFLKDSLRDGILLFKKIFGISPKSFVPSNAIFHPDLEVSLVETGVEFLHAGFRDPVYHSNGKVSYYRRTFGEKSSSGLTYYMRTCAFEPTSEVYPGIELTLNQIKSAFRWNKPAIIGTHRVNFVGGINSENRQKGLNELKSLLSAILIKWPEVEFSSSSDLLVSMKEYNSKN